jgi:signal peptidase I
VLGLVVVAAAPFVLPIPTGMFLRARLMQAFKVPSGAMIPSVQVGDHLFVDMRIDGRSVRRGDVIVFAFPEHPDQDFIKRVIVAPGDKLEVRNGHPIINGWEIPSCRVGTWKYTEEMDSSSHEGELFVEFLERSAYLVFFDKGFTTDYQGPYIAKPNEWWVLGDNRNNSHDSRMWWGGEGGGVPNENIRGRASVVWLGAPGRFGLDIGGVPMAPSSDLAAPLAKCLADRPTIEKATPPKP